MKKTTISILAMAFLFASLPFHSFACNLLNKQVLGGEQMTNPCPMCFGTGTYITYHTVQMGSSDFPRTYAVPNVCSMCNGTGNWGNAGASKSQKEEDNYSSFVYEKLLGKWQCTLPGFTGKNVGDKRIFHEFNRDGSEKVYSDYLVYPEYNYWSNHGAFRVYFYKYHPKTATTGTLEFYEFDRLIVTANVDWINNDTFYCTSSFNKNNRADVGRRYLCRRTD